MTRVLVAFVLLMLMGGALPAGAHHKPWHQSTAVPPTAPTSPSTATAIPPTPIPPTEVPPTEVPPTDVPVPAEVYLTVYVYDYTNPDWQIQVAYVVDYYTSILGGSGYTFVHVPMETIDDPAVCKAQAPPGIRVCYDPNIASGAGSTGRRYVDNGDGTWGITANMYLRAPGTNPAPDGIAAKVLPCHEMGHITGSLGHTDGFSEDCMNTSRWQWPYLRDEQVAQILTVKPTEPPPSAGVP